MKKLSQRLEQLIELNSIIKKIENRSTLKIISSDLDIFYEFSIMNVIEIEKAITESLIENALDKHNIIINNIKEKLINYNDFQNKHQRILEKINLGEIIIIDKVFDEFLGQEFKDFRKEIKKSVQDTMHLFEKVSESMNKYYIESNERFYKDELQILEEKERMERGYYADLYLIEKCKEIKKNGKKPILITEENFKGDGKLFEKIPKICKNEEIECKMIPHALFEVYKEELKFTLKI